MKKRNVLQGGILQAAFVSWCAVTSALSLGCAGGGTSGTGISGIARMTGSAFSASGQPVPSMTIMVSTPFEDRTIRTSADGTYDTFIQYEVDQPIEFHFQGEEIGIDSRWTFDRVPEGTAVIRTRWDESVRGEMRPTTSDFLDEDEEPVPVDRDGR